MIKYIHIHKIKSLLSIIVWKFFFSGRYKLFGKGARVFSPDYIIGEENISIHDNVYIGYKAVIIVQNSHDKNMPPPSLVFEAGTKIRRFFHVVCVDEVVLGKNVLIADKVFISDNIHDYEDVNTPILEQPLKNISKVIIGDGTCLGENVCVIGAKIGKNCTIGANSVVVKDIPDYSIAVGIPAKVIKRYDFKLKKWIRA